MNIGRKQKTTEDKLKLRDKIVSRKFNGNPVADKIVHILCYRDVRI